MEGPRPREQLIGGSSACRDFAALTARAEFLSNGDCTYKLLEGADADIHSPYLSLLCGVDELSMFPSRAAPTSWSRFRTSIVSQPAGADRAHDREAIAAGSSVARAVRRGSRTRRRRPPAIAACPLNADLGRATRLRASPSEGMAGGHSSSARALHESSARRRGCSGYAAARR
jgi:hypothetical protein